MEQTNELRYCTCCRVETMQQQKACNPDMPEDGKVWQCSQCYEPVELVENSFKPNSQLHPVFQELLSDYYGREYPVEKLLTR